MHYSSQLKSIWKETETRISIRTLAMLIIFNQHHVMVKYSIKYFLQISIILQS